MFQGNGFTSALRAEHDVYFRISGQQLVGAIVAAICDPHDSEFVFRIVERQGVLHLLFHDILFVVGADHQGHRGQLLICRKNGFAGFSCEQPFQPDDDV